MSLPVFLRGKRETASLLGIWVNIIQYYIIYYNSGYVATQSFPQK